MSIAHRPTATLPALPMIASALVGYQAHVQNIGWQVAVYDDGVAGTTGQALRMEALRVQLNGLQLPQAGVRYRAHVQNLGWQGWVADGAVAGTTGQSLRMEALNLELTGAPGWDIHYQAHVQNVGWQPEVANGAVAGTTGEGLRMEALRIRVAPAPSTLPASLALYRIGWGDFSGPCFMVSPDQELCPTGDLRDDDDIYLEVMDDATLQPGQLAVVLHAAPRVTWWKEIKAFRTDGAATNWVSTQDDARGPVSFVVDARTTGALVFSKAKALGIHTGVYDLRDLPSMAGKRVTFTWREPTDS